MCVIDARRFIVLNESTESGLLKWVAVISYQLSVIRSPNFSFAGVQTLVWQRVQTLVFVQDKYWSP